jgi:predicted unusual protein kinase regulating ubiquinone biosynthesis (AarF/ABC1/UbiB family)
MSLGQLREVDPAEILDDIETLLYNQPFHLPAEFAFLGRAMAMLVGLATHLSPDFNFLEVATPYARTFMFGSGLTGALRLVGVDSVEQLGRDLVRESVSIARSLSAIPHTLERVLTHAERGDLRLIIESPTFDPRLRRRSRFVAPSMLRRPVPAWVPLGIIGAYVFGVVMRRHGPGD